MCFEVNLAKVVGPTLGVKGVVAVIERMTEQERGKLFSTIGIHKAGHTYLLDRRAKVIKEQIEAARKGE